MHTLANTDAINTMVYHYKYATLRYTSNLFKKNARFSHYNKLRREWEYLIFFISLASIAEVTFVYFIDPNITLAQYCPFFIFDIIFALDHYIIRRTLCISNGEIVDDPKKIIAAYGKFHLFFHLISIFPFAWIGIITKYKFIYVLLSINKFFRLSRAWTSWKTLNTLLPYIGSFATLLPSFIILLFVVHVFAIILMILSKFEKETVIWTTQFKDQGYNDIKLYVVAIYFVLTTVSTIGYGDVIPKTTNEVMVMIFIQLFGVILHTAIIARMISVFFNTLEYTFINSYKVTQDYLKFKKIDDNRRREVRNFCQYYWETTGAAGGIRNLLRNVPKSLRTTIKLEITRKFFDSIVCFSSLTPGQLAKVAKIIKHITFEPGSFLCRQGEKCNFMLFVGRGIISIIVDDQVIASESCTESTVHGENQMLLGSQCATSIRALMQGFISR